jgi:DnaJ family protein B protein 4
MGKQDEKIISIDVKPGWKAGTKVTFENEGDQKPGIIPADLVFVLAEKPHPVFQRQGNDLIYTAKISLKQALTSPTFEIPHLDGKTRKISIQNVITPDYVETVRGEGNLFVYFLLIFHYLKFPHVFFCHFFFCFFFFVVFTGMPISKSPGQKGDLLIKFKIDFPRSLSAQQKEMLARALP